MDIDGKSYLTIWLRLLLILMWNLIEFNWFRTHFCLWNRYVAYNNQCLFTVSHFVPKHVSVPYYPPISSIASDNTIFYDHIKIKPRRTTLNCFHYLKVLDIWCSISPRFFLSEIDLSRLEHLSLVFVYRNDQSRDI